MTSSLHRALGAYFVVTALAYVPASVFMLGVENTYGPQWVLWAIPLTQGAITAVAGLWLLRQRPPSGQAPTTLVSPPVETLVQLFGLYFLIGGLVGITSPLSSMLFLNEVWSPSVGGRVGSPVASIAIGLYLVARPSAVAGFLTRQAAEGRHQRTP